MFLNERMHLKSKSNSQAPSAFPHVPVRSIPAAGQRDPAARPPRGWEARAGRDPGGLRVLSAPHPPRSRPLRGFPDASGPSLTFLSSPAEGSEPMAALSVGVSPTRVPVCEGRLRPTLPGQRSQRAPRAGPRTPRAPWSQHSSLSQPGRLGRELWFSAVTVSLFLPLFPVPPALLPRPSLFWSSGGALGQPTPPLGVPAPAWHHVGLSKSMWDVSLDRRVNEGPGRTLRPLEGTLGLRGRSKGWRMDFCLGRSGHRPSQRPIGAGPRQSRPFVHSCVHPVIQQLILTEQAHRPAPDWAPATLACPLMASAPGGMGRGVACAEDTALLSQHWGSE